METAQGTVSKCQHTVNVSGGANNTSTSTAYIALFRVDGRPVQFRSSQPSSISDGDNVAVAGLMWRGSLDVLALRNLTTGEVVNTGVWGYVFGAVILLVIGGIFWVVAGHLAGALAQGAAALFILGLEAYFIHRAILTRRAIELVRG